MSYITVSLTCTGLYRVQNPRWLLSDTLLSLKPGHICVSEAVFTELTRLILYLYCSSVSVKALVREALVNHHDTLVWIDIREPSITVCLAILHFWLYFLLLDRIICSIFYTKKINKYVKLTKFHNFPGLNFLLFSIFFFCGKMYSDESQNIKCHRCIFTE